MKIAAAAYPIDRPASFDAWADKISRWVEEAAGAGTELLVFPEYGAMELAALAPGEAGRDLEASARAVSDHMPRADALHAELARRHGVHILAGSGPVLEGPRPVNRARLFGPAGLLGHQDKQVMTRYEREIWNLRPNGPLRVFDTALGRLGILICYDSEFPLLARALVEAGAEILLVPSATEAMTGYSRVRIGAMARALENQCYVVHAPTVGAAPWCEAVDMNVGAAAVYGPPDLGFPADGVVAQGALNQPGWTYAQLDIGAVGRVRRDGGVVNHADWPRQHAAAKNVEIVAART
jgi:predicted amidohydrolase